MQAKSLTHKERNSNLELYRIVVMLLIVMHHYVVNSGLTATIQENPDSARSIFLLLMGMWGKTGINCFVLITGYFMCKSNITLHKALKLILQIMFYNFVISLIFWVSGYEQYSFGRILYHTFPIHNISRGFTSGYLIFFMFIPFMNILIHNMTRKQHGLMICLFVGVYTLLESVPQIKVAINYPTWFCILYFVSSYIRLYPVYRKDDKTFWGNMLVANITASVLSVLILFKYFNISGGVNPMLSYWFVSDSNHILALTTSVSAFMFANNIKIKNSKFINRTAACMFGVLLIHANSDVMRRYIWKDLCDNVGMFTEPLFYAHAILVPVAIMTVCVIIDYTRIHTIETPAIKWTEDVVLKSYNRLYYLWRKK